MISTNAKLYNYYTFGELNDYGQYKLSEEVQGQIKMSIYITSQSVQDNILYKDSAYIGLTRANIDDTYVIEYGDEKLKVLYVNNSGRIKQVFLQRIG